MNASIGRVPFVHAVGWVRLGQARGRRPYALPTRCRGAQADIRLIAGVIFALVGVGAVLWALQPRRSYFQPSSNVLTPATEDAPAEPVQYDLQPAQETIAKDIQQFATAIRTAFTPASIPAREKLAVAAASTLDWLWSGSKEAYLSNLRARGVKAPDISDETWELKSRAFRYAPLDSHSLRVRARVLHGQPQPDSRDSPVLAGYQDMEIRRPVRGPGEVDPQRDGLSVYEVLVPMRVTGMDGQEAAARVGLSYAYDPRRKAWVPVSIKVYDLPAGLVVLAPSP